MNRSTFMTLPLTVQFLPNQLPALVKHLEDVERNTEVAPVGSADELTLNNMGTTDVGRSLLSVTAVAAICRQACPGLFKTIASLSGLMVDEKRPPCPQEAKVVYCRVIRARFDDTLADKSVVRDVNLNQIDGIIGAGYQYLSNRRFFDLVQDAVEQAVPQLVFHGARVTGRTMVVTYRRGKPIVTKPHTYYPGIYFVNSELGDHSVRVANILVQEKTGYQATSPFQEGRIVHSGRDFRARVARTLQGAINKYNDNGAALQGYLEKGLARLPMIPLGFKGLAATETKDRIEELITRLCRKKVGNQHAERVIYTALNWGAESRPPMGTYEAAARRETWGARSAYDLFVTLIRDAASRPMSYRLALERVAYDLAIGKKTLIR